MKPIAKLLAFFAPAYQFPFKEKNVKPFVQHWREDPNSIVNKICAQSVLISDSASKKGREELINKVKTPFFLITANKDTIVCSEAAKKFFENCPYEDKQIMDFADADHEIVKDREYVGQVITETIAW